MNLPNLSPLRNDQSTYITFNKSLVDFDRAENANQPCYFSKMVALNLPLWQNPDFFIDLSSMGITDNPNTIFPKMIQYYMENIVRQDYSDGSGGTLVGTENVTEIAFWKTLSKLGLSKESIDDSIVFVNDIATSNFVNIENNNGWGTIVCEIPNKCSQLTLAKKEITTFPNVLINTYEDDCLHDDEAERKFEFSSEQKEVIDFDNLVFDEVTETTFDFNVLLLFYTDSDGIVKLHGINFIQPFTFATSNYYIPKFTHKTNVIQTIGYQFKFNLKTCNNQESIDVVHTLQEHTMWNAFSETLGVFNEFLEIQKQSITE